MNPDENGKIKGLVFDIQRFSTHDGPGIRTTVFLKGCPLSCSWCHNPESQSSEYELFFNKNSCIGCESCNKICPFGGARELLSAVALRHEKCGTCNLCADVCPSKAIERIGKIYTSGEIVEEAEKDRPFYENSGGGITISGGEPMFQFDFTLDILKKLNRKQIHTVIETSGYTTPGRILEIAPYTDLFLWDIKATNETLHKKYTGVSFNPIIKNLKLIDLTGAKTILRLIIVPGVNMNNLHYENIANLYNELENIQGIELLKYHDYGISKREKLGLTESVTFRGPTDQDLDRIRELFSKMNRNITILTS
jgi:pyruvate formate lyase activating enzyme